MCLCCLHSLYGGYLQALLQTYKLYAASRGGFERLNSSRIKQKRRAAKHSIVAWHLYIT